MKLLTWNVAFAPREKLDLIAETLERAAADIVTLNEADHEDVMADLAERLGMFYVWAHGSGDRHVATLSRFPITRWQIYNKKPLTQAALSTTLDVNGSPLTVYNVHFRPDPYWYFEPLRYLAANALLRVINREAPQTHLIMGDLNTFGKGDPVDVHTILRYMRPQDRLKIKLQRHRFLRLAHPRLLRAGYVDCFRQHSPTDPGFTFMRHRLPVSRMDYILADRVMAKRLLSCHVMQAVDPAASDHVPVIALFQ
jgi:exonuclease III